MNTAHTGTSVARKLETWKHEGSCGSHKVIGLATMKKTMLGALLLVPIIMMLGCESGERPAQRPVVGRKPAGQPGAGADSPDAVKVRTVRVMNTLPGFRLVSQSGDPFGSQELEGKVWIATFIFTRCAQTCPMQTAELVKIQNRLKDHPASDLIRFISISVDPAHDTPQILNDYAVQRGSDLSRWTYLTGKREEIWALSKEGFKLPVTDVDADPDALIAHSQSFVLVDQSLRVRGHYDGLNVDARKRLLSDLEAVLLE